MRRITLVRTFDGINHSSEKDALKYLDNKQGDIILKVARQLVHLTKYKQITEYIDKNMDSFAEILRIRRDMVMDDEDPEDRDE